MKEQTSIQLISRMLAGTEGGGRREEQDIAALQQAYPYFVPAHYAAALIAQRSRPFSTVAMTAIYPYAGNKLLLAALLGMAAGHDITATAGSAINDSHGPATNADILIESAPAAITAPEPEIAALPEAPAEQGEAQVAGDIPAILPTQEEESTAAAAAPADTAPEEAPAALPADSPHHAQLPAPEAGNEEELAAVEEELHIPAPFADDYFKQQGINVADDIPAGVHELKDDVSDEDKALMVIMSFREWLLHFKKTTEKIEEEQKEQKALKTMWQKEKLAAAIEEENDEIPENVFEMAVNSITAEDGLASESLAIIYTKQEKYDEAIEMYRKLSLQNPKKNTYFARKIEEILKKK